MFIADVVIGLLVSLVVGLIFTLFCIPYFTWKDIDNPFAETKWYAPIIAIIIITCIVGGVFTTYFSKTEELEKLRVSANYNVQNILTLANNLNEKAVVKTTNNEIIVDVANFSQSTITSDVYKQYVVAINTYNATLAEFKVRCKPGLIYRIYYGVYPDLPEDLKYIKITL
jgi:hypothetical protein